MSNTMNNVSVVCPIDQEMIKDERKFHGRRSIIREFSLNTSTHGLPGIARSEHMRNRIFWSISFICFTAIMIYFVVTAIINYFNYPTQINVSIGLEWPQYFPAVTICNVSPFRFDKFIGPFLNYSNALNLTNLNDTSTFSDIQANYIGSFVQYIINSNQSFEQFSFSLSSMLYKCTYNSFPCSTADFIPFISPSYGLCYTFNAKMKNSSNDSVRYANQGGGSGTLDLSFYVHSHQYVPYLTDSVGMMALVHDNTQVPFAEGPGLQLAPGRKHMLSFKKKTNFFLSLPYTTCTENIPFSLKTVFNSYNANYAYSQFLCAELCMQAYLYEQCSCVHPYLWNMRSIVLPDTKENILAPICDYSDPCYPGAANTFMASLSLLNKYCRECTPQCSTIDFIVQVSSLTTPMEWQMKGIKAFVENSSVPLPLDWSSSWRTEIQRNYLAVSVVRESATVDSNTQTAQLGLVDVLSNIGGQTGLWIGISFLSLMEFIEMIYRLIRYQCHLIRVAIRRKQQIIPQ